MTYHAMFSLYIMTGLLALVISVSLFCKSIAEAKEWKRKFGAIRFGMGEVQNAMVEWAEQYGKYTSGEITLEEYKDWKRKYQADEPEDESRSDDSFLKDKPVVCLECEERFASIGDAAAKLHLNARKLGNAIRENEPYHGLHFFLIAESWQDETK